ncbi:MAG: hypothetical protein HYU66_23170 [Armatimonadetes bacterium]|nr:hypothetical protein [Armatimonadota bacterium]
MPRWLTWYTALAALPALAGPNLLRNPGGEDGTAAWGGDCQRVTTTAHAGSACFTATVTAAEQHHSLTQTLTLEADVPYEVSFWARSDQANMVVFWIERPGDRRNPGRWEKLPAAWRGCTAVFTVPVSAAWELQFVVPSSHGGQPVGTAWVDDLSLTALAAGRPATLSAAGDYADQPSLAAGAGALWGAWEVAGPDRDRLVIALLDPGPPVTVARTWNLDFGAGSYTLWPRLVGGPGGIWLVTAAEVRGRWGIRAVPLGADGPGRAVAVTDGADSAVGVAGVLDGGRLWLAWVGNRGGARRVWLSAIQGLRAERPVAAGEEHSYNPALALGGGRVHLVYDRFVDGGRDLWLRVLEGGRWSAPRRLTRSNRYDLNPAAVWWRGGLWVAWESGTFAGYRTNSLDRRSIRLAEVTDSGLLAAKGLEQGVAGEPVEQPALAVDAHGRLWLAWRQARGAAGREGWETRLRVFGGDAWTDQGMLSGGTGRSREPALAALDDLVVGAQTVDTVGPGWKSNADAATVTSKVVALAVPTADLPAAAGLQTAPFVDADEPQFPFPAELHRMGEDRPAFTTDLAGRRLLGCFGNLHEHSDISVCARAADVRTEEDYVAMRELGRLDFGAVTDHGYNISPPAWRYSAKITRASHDPGRFVTFVAEEWTSDNERHTKPPGYYGHRNLIFADPYEPQWYNSRDPSYFTPRQVWDTLGERNYIMIPHQLADSGNNVPTDWSYTDELKQPVAEIFQARESYEADTAPRRTANGWPGYFIQDAWAKGIRIGVIASPDHGGGKGKAGVLVDRLTREAVLDACRARHTWGSTAAKIAVAMTVDGHLMGDIVRQPQVGPVRVKVVVSAVSPVAVTRIIRNNQVVYSFGGPGPELSFEYLDNAPLNADSYYYVRVEQQDGELAWSSPVWLDRKA